MYNHYKKNYSYLNDQNTDYLEDIPFDNMPFSPSSPEEICCSPSSDPFTSQQESAPIVVSPKDINTKWPMEYENMIPHSFTMPTHRHSLNLSTFRVGHKPRSKSVDTPHRFFIENYEIPSDDEESTLSQQSQFHMELSEEEVDEMSLDDESIELDYSRFSNGMDNGEIWENTCEIEEINVVLNVSKTPILDALAFCVAMRLGAYQTNENKQRGEIVVFNASKFLNGIHYFCPKKAQTQNDEARIKALKRWFDGIPAKKKRNQPFVMKIKPNKVRDVEKIMHKMKKFIVENGLLQPINKFC